MDVKKYAKVDVRKYQNLFLQIGFIVALGLVLFAFKLATPEKKEQISLSGTEIDYEPELIPITQREEPKPQPAPQAKALKLVIAEEMEEFEEPEIMETEAFEETSYQPVVLEAEPEAIEETPLDRAEIMPSFPGGTKAMFAYFSKTVKYPQRAIENGVYGTVFVEFTVDKRGKIKDAHVLREMDQDLEAEALRVVNAMPDWSPGIQGGNLVEVYFRVPISFRLH